MNRSELEHVVRAAAAITNHTEFIVVGSQALLGEHPDAPAELLTSMEIDLYPRRAPEDSVLIDGAIGEGSMFQATFGYYGHGVEAETATLPEGWEDRCIPVRSEATHGATAWCLETHDLASSKLVAARQKDHDFLAGLLRAKLIDIDTLRVRVETVSVDDRTRRACLARIDRLAHENRA